MIEIVAILARSRTVQLQRSNGTSQQPISACTGDRIQNDSNQNTGYQSQRQCTTVQDPPVEVPSGYSITLSILDEGGEHRVVLQSQSPAKPDQNGMVRMRVATALQY